MADEVFYVVLGIGAGLLSGLIGLGGGSIIVPVLVMLLGFSQREAQGTTLALLLPPIGLPAAWAYYRHGDVNAEAAMLIAAGFVLGGFIGAKFAVGAPTVLLERMFGGAMLLISLKMLFAK